MITSPRAACLLDREPPPVGQPAKLVLRPFFRIDVRSLQLGAERVSNFHGIHGVTMCRTFDETLGRLHVTQAYIELLIVPERTRMVPVARTGGYEIRMLRLPRNGSNSEPAVWMELFDLGTQLSVDSIRCSEVEDALAAFQEFVTRAKSL